MSNNKIVNVQVDCAIFLCDLTRMWKSLGYDEINLTYTTRGKNIFKEVGKLKDVPYWIRNHNTFTTGNGLGAPARGSGNVYSEDWEGNPVYNWAILDQVYDIFLQKD